MEVGNKQIYATADWAMYITRTSENWGWKILPHWLDFKFYPEYYPDGFGTWPKDPKTGEALPIRPMEVNKEKKSLIDRILDRVLPI